MAPINTSIAFDPESFVNEETAREQLQEAIEDIKSGRVYKGDLKKLLEKV